MSNNSNNTDPNSGQQIRTQENGNPDSMITGTTEWFITNNIPNTVTQIITDQVIVDDIPSDSDPQTATENGTGVLRGTPIDMANIFQQMFQNQFGVSPGGDNNGAIGIEALFDNVRGQRNKKKATENALNHLKRVDVHDLEDKTCSICYEPYDQEKKAKDGKSADKRLEPLDNDPAILLPTDATGRKYSQFKKPMSLANEEHIPVEMPCKHIFGRSCLIEWLKDHNSCPLCRKEVESQIISAKEKVQNIPRTFVSADWSSSELSGEDPSVPLPNISTGFSPAFNIGDGTTTVAFQFVNNLVGRYINE